MALWTNESPQDQHWSEAASAWLTPGIAASTRSAVTTLATSPVHSAVVGTEIFESDFETRVFVTVERFDPRTGAFSVFAVEVLLVRAVTGWAVAALEFAR